MTRREDLQQFFISANTSQDFKTYPFDLDEFTDAYIERNPIDSALSLPLSNYMSLIKLDKEAYQKIKALLSGESVTTEISGELFIIYKKEILK